MEKKSIVINRIQEKVRVITLKDVIVNEDTHPELKGMSEQEMISYIRENIEVMKPIDPKYDNLEAEVSHSPIQGEEYFIADDNIVVLPYEHKEDISILDDDDEDDPYDDDDDFDDD